MTCFRGRLRALIGAAGLIAAGLQAQGAEGDSLLHLAALRGDETQVRSLLAHQAKPDAANAAGATPLLYGVGNLAITRMLLDHGADVNHVAKNGMTPLLAAVARDRSAPVVKLLLAHGANVHVKLRPKHGEDALAVAIHGGDQQTIALVLAAGAKISPEAPPYPLGEAAFQGDLDTARLLLERGADPTTADEFAGTVLNVALYANNREMARLLIAHGADPRKVTAEGYHTPPMVLAAYNQTGDAGIARALVACGAPADEANEAGETALSYALKTGPQTELVAYLRGLKTGSAAAPASSNRDRSIPNRTVAAGGAAREAQIRGAAQSAVAALQVSSKAFLDDGFVRSQAKCISCHQQLLPAAAFAAAAAHKLKLDAAGLGQQFEVQNAEWNAVKEDAREVSEPIPDMPLQVGYNAEAWHAWGQPRNELTDAMSHYTLAIQRADGSWSSHDRRPPIEDGLITGTAWSARMLQLYPPTGEEAAARRALDRARHWLAAQHPSYLDDVVFQLFGLDWTGAGARQLSPMIKAILAQQRPDGGWAQLPGRESDAYATGEVLVALHQSGHLATDHPAYQRGIAFLLRTQFADGSWWVRTRTWPFQPHFNGRFPHGKDQWISAAGTAWATRALLDALPAAPSARPLPTPDALVAAYVRGKPAQTAVAVAAAAKAPEVKSGTVTFARDIKPLLQRSCLDCHSGKSPRGQLTLAERAGLLSGGQSGDPAVVPGYGEESVLVHMVADEVEDLEMPPLNKRHKYPALNREEIDRLKTWIDEGVPWTAAEAKPSPATGN